jgi:thiosulfate reductase cytochrome b subunit
MSGPTEPGRDREGAAPQREAVPDVEASGSTGSAESGAPPPAEPGPTDLAGPAAAARPTEPTRGHGGADHRAGAHRHHWIVRITHWSAFVLVFAMIASGLQIYRAYPRFGERGGPYYPNPFHDAAFPEWARLGGWLAGGINWHFLLMWPLAVAAILYVIYLLATGEWKKLVFRPRDARPAIEMARYYLRLRKEHPPQGKHNALQKAAYTSVLLLGALAMLTGIAMWKPVQLWWLTALFGGFQAARYWHFWTVWLFVGFAIVHVVLVFTADPASLRAMISGRYRGRYTSDEP